MIACVSGDSEEIGFVQHLDAWVNFLYLPY